ncbi:hypothetical protein [Niveispirillum sp. KHB5.9]|uniref:hypothetical protein n=1 Tax=Niveispirillum sp. KHB5.9 TaxID=3400269 RepID=UPI003A8B54D0
MIVDRGSWRAKIPDAFEFSALRIYPVGNVVRMMAMEAKDVMLGRAWASADLLHVSSTAHIASA